MKSLCSILIALTFTLVGCTRPSPSAYIETFVGPTAQFTDIKLSDTGQRPFSTSFWITAATTPAQFEKIIHENGFSLEDDYRGIQTTDEKTFRLKELLAQRGTDTLEYPPSQLLLRYKREIQISDTTLTTEIFTTADFSYVIIHGFDE